MNFLWRFKKVTVVQPFFFLFTIHHDQKMETEYLNYIIYVLIYNTWIRYTLYTFNIYLNAL